MKQNRREFLGMGAMAGAGILMAERGGQAAEKPSAADAGKPAKSGTVKFCVFADIHYRPGPKGFPHSTKEWLGRVLSRAERENCDFVIHCGDFCHNPPADKEYVDYYNDFRLPTYHTIGNHDDDGCAHEETLRAYRMDKGYYYFDRNAFRFIVIDANYVRWADGRVEHYSHGSYFRKGKVPELKPFYEKGKHDDIGVVPQEELDWLRDTIESSPYPCVCFSHQSFERPTGNPCHNGAEVRAIFDAANAKTPGKVRLVINGHHHCDYLRILENVVYFDLNSASFYWMGSKYAHRKYPDSFFDENGQTPREVSWVSWDDPINAIVTLTADGGIRIDGMKSKFTCGVTPGMCRGFRLDPCSRLVVPDVQSANLRLSYSA